MKKTFAFIFIVFTFSLLFGCSDNKQLKTVTNKEALQKEYIVGGEKIVLKKKELLSNKIEMLLPESFHIMSEEVAKIKYPNENRPTIIYTNDKTTINISLKYTTTQINDSQIPEFHNSIKQMFEKLYPSAKWLDEKVIKTNDGKNVGVLEVITPAIDTNIYNFMYLIELDNKVLIATFNCTEEKMDDWKPIAKEIMGSIVTTE
ncbi:hypothetical protein BACCIP111895_02288 [Neobacillus rhizosphaerae]|uniref:PsbP C-terminal domain-containing protein n=1 Tax=Neobacillus rhizosphaerae TaxID=2880965 RepID=A0ABM9ER36_9BACI|nr:hypothetical protein [Neobacillus rhizosphaerae]CAH2715104.1 hypothetical protein BACCIP111895_02288 [Neobacillus rhizosphaerae]